MPWTYPEPQSKRRRTRLNDSGFRGIRKTAPNQLKIGDGRELTNTKNFTEGFFFDFEFFRYFGAHSRADLAQAGSQKSGRGGKKTENHGKRSAAARGRPRVPRGAGVAGSGPCGTAEGAGNTFEAKSRTGSSPSPGFPLFYPLVFSSQGTKIAENARTPRKPLPSQFLSARTVQWC